MRPIAVALLPALLLTLAGRSAVADAIRGARPHVAKARLLAPGAWRLPDGRLLLQSLTEPDLYVIVEVRELGLVAPGARQTIRGVRAGTIARNSGRKGYPNRKFYRNPRIACAAYVSWVLRQAGIRRTSNSATGLYSLLRSQGGRLVATKVSTRYVGFFPYYKAGDVLFFWKGRNRIGHVELYVGSGLTVGTSSKALRIGIRPLGNRGFRTMSVMRI